MNKIIFDAHSLEEEIPPKFNAVKITLDGQVKANLDWNVAKEKACLHKEKGLGIFWEMDLGLFKHLTLPLTSQAQFLSLCLSLEHFRDTLWKEFQEESIGVCLYRGSPDFSSDFRWNSEQLINFQEWLQDRFVDVKRLNEDCGHQLHSFSEATPQNTEAALVSLFCRDAIGEYLDLLAARLPDSLRCFLLFDCSHLGSLSLTSQLVTKERYPKFHLGVKNGVGNGEELVWESPAEKNFIGRQAPSKIFNENIRYGICLPSMAVHSHDLNENLEQALSTLNHFNLPFRVISEVFLTHEWDGLDFLFVNSKNISLQGRRKLQGFCAAGGTVISLGGSAGVPMELGFEEWLDLQKKSLST